MTLVTCPECSRSISSVAVACPGCGHPVPVAVPASGPVLTLDADLCVRCGEPLAPGRSHEQRLCLECCDECY